MALVTVAELRTHVQTDLTDPAVQRLLDDADDLIVERYGPHAGPVTVELEGGHALVFPPRPVLAATTITEYASRDLTTGVVLAASDYRLLYGGRVIERLATGANARSAWGERVVITHTIAPSTARRARVEIDLVRLALTYEARRSESVGDFSSQHVEYEAERAKLLRSLGAPIGVH